MKINVRHLLIIVFISLVSMKGLSQTSNSPSYTLTSQDQQNSKMFIKSKGKDRTFLFNELKGLIKSISDLTYSKTKFTLTSEKEVISLLGNPDRKVSDYSYEYYLNPKKKNCLVLINYNTIGEVVSCSIYDCN